MILLPHAKRIAHDFGRGMAFPACTAGVFYSVHPAPRALQAID